MANVLGELFGDIASAIREKTGDEATMKPAQFSVKIREIEGSAETEATSVDANFTVGDMVIQPSEGKLLEMVTVKKPADLIPENIKLGVDIAGIIGSLMPGGNGSVSQKETRVDTGTFDTSVTGTGRIYLNHSLGEVPDFVAVFLIDTRAAIDKDTKAISCMYQFNSGIVKLLYGMIGLTNSYSTTFEGLDKPLNSAVDGVSISIRCLDKSTIRIGSDADTAQKFLPDSEYVWYAYYGVGNIISGSAADIRYVTFMNDDGTVEYGKKAVAVGDDCADPISRGIFSTPTKESTAQYNYTFSGGWATEPNGGKDSNALKNVTEDRTVYANFIAAVRYYTITYYDSDGTTVLKTESLAYGTMPGYEPSHDEYDFGEWTPALAAVTGDASYTAVWKEKATFATATWAEIAEICNSGKASETFAVGDKKAITMNYDDGTSETINFTIVAMGADKVWKDSAATASAITVMADNIVSISPTLAYNGKRQNDFNNYPLIKTFLNRVYSAFPEELQAVISDWLLNGYADWGGMSKVFVPHCINLGVSNTGYGSTYDTPSNYNGTYRYFANGASILRTKLNDASADDYWTSGRTAKTTKSYIYMCIDGTAKLPVEVDDDELHGIVPCFCI